MTMQALMKRLMLMAFLLPQLAVAQTTEAKVKRIRQLYNSAQETARYMDSEEWMEHAAWFLQFQSQVNYAGGGPVKHRTEVLLTSPRDADEPDSPRFNTVCPWLTRETIERSATIYREMLFDPLTEELVFCYQRVSGGDSPREQRLYFDRGRLLKALPAEKPDLWMQDPPEILNVAHALKEMVRNYNTIE